MRTLTWAVVVAAGMGMAAPASGGSPVPPEGGGAGSGEATTSEVAASKPGGEASSIQVEEIRTGAGSMEPSDADTPESRSERAFVENVWNSP
jgi:hypothetical protein